MIPDQERVERSICHWSENIKYMKWASRNTWSCVAIKSERKPVNKQVERSKHWAYRNTWMVKTSRICCFNGKTWLTQPKNCHKIQTHYCANIQFHLNKHFYVTTISITSPSKIFCPWCASNLLIPRFCSFNFIKFKTTQTISFLAI